MRKITVTEFMSLDGVIGFGDRVSAPDRVVGAIAAPAGVVLREGVA